jgi:hypothetical protein
MEQESTAAVTMGFGQALEAFKAGRRIARSSWSNNVWLQLQYPDEPGKTAFIHQDELLCEDWVVLP